MAAVTGELHNSTTVPAVPEFAGDERPTKRRRRPPSARSSRSGPVSKKTSGGTVVTFPPQSAPTWSDPSTTIADRDPLNQPFDDFRPVEIGPPVRAEADVIAPPIVAAEAPAETGRVDPENEVVDLQNEAADIEQGFATETAPIPATTPRNQATEPPALFPDQADPEFDFDESQQLFSAQTIDVAPDRLAIHFSEVTGPLPSSVTAQPEGEGQQPPPVMDQTDSLSDTGHIAEDHDGQPDRDQTKESDQELDALLAELSAVSESAETVEEGDVEVTEDGSPAVEAPVESAEAGAVGPTVPAPEITPPQPPENFSALLKPPSILSPQDTAVIYGLPSQPTDTPVAPNAEAPIDALPKVGPRRVVPSKQPSETRFEDAVSPRRPISPPGALAKQQDQTVSDLDLDSLPPPSPEQYVAAPSLEGAPDIASAEVFGSETSVFPAIKTRRGDVVGPEQAEGSWFTRSAELPYIRVEDSEPEVVRPRRRWLRYTFLVLLVLAIAAVAIIVALQPSGTLPFLNN